jgi:hypothetical protein
MHINFHGAGRPHWLVHYLECPRYFIESLPDLVGYGAVLYLESYEGRDEFRQYLARHRASPDTIEPVGDACTSIRPAWVEHVIISADLVADIETYHSEWYHTPADHVHCYRDGKLLFWFHDAFTGGDLQISPEISEERVSRFCRALAPRYHHVSS